MRAIWTHTPTAALALAAAVLLTTATAGAQETIAHLILEVIKGDDGDTMGYRIHHEKHLEVYVAMLAPGGAGQRRCSVSAKDRL